MANATYNTYIYKTDLGQQPLCIQRLPVGNFALGTNLFTHFISREKAIAFWQWAAIKHKLRPVVHYPQDKTFYVLA